MSEEGDYLTLYNFAVNLVPKLRFGTVPGPKTQDPSQRQLYFTTKENLFRYPPKKIFSAVLCGKGVIAVFAHSARKALIISSKLTLS